MKQFFIIGGCLLTLVLILMLISSPNSGGTGGGATYEEEEPYDAAREVAFDMMRRSIRHDYGYEPDLTEPHKTAEKFKSETPVYSMTLTLTEIHTKIDYFFTVYEGDLVQLREVYTDTKTGKQTNVKIIH